MVTLRAWAELAPVDVGAARDTLALLLTRLRALRFADTGLVHPATGVVHAGLRDLSGTHPAAGTRYQLSFPATGGGRDDATIEVVGDDDAHLIIAADGERFAAEVTVQHPARPSAVDATVTQQLATGHWYLDGELRAVAAIDLDRLPGDPAPIDLRGVHRRLRGAARIGVTVLASGRWQLDLELEGHGRGVLKPLLALIVLAFRVRIERELQVQFAEAVRTVDAELSALNARADLASIADEIVGDLVAAIPITLAEPVR